MKAEDDIRAAIDTTTKAYRHVLDCGPATIQINAPRALMQVEAIARLDVMYAIVGEKRPRFKCDEISKTNH